MLVSQISFQIAARKSTNMANCLSLIHETWWNNTQILDEERCFSTFSVYNFDKIQDRTFQKIAGM